MISGMSNGSYAMIEEVWGAPLQKSKTKKAKQDPACGLYKRKNTNMEPLDDIMSTYMDDAPYDKYERLANSTQRIKSRDRHLKAVEIKPTEYEYDAIIPEEQEPPTTRLPRARSNKCFNADIIEGVNGGSMTRQAYDYDRYYTDNIIVDDEEYEDKNVACIVDDDNITNTPGDGQPRISKSALSKEDIYKELVMEQYADYLRNEKQSASSGYAELIMYIGSGIILIFMMEQILQLGTYLR